MNVFSYQSDKQGIVSVFKVSCDKRAEKGKNKAFSSFLRNFLVEIKNIHCFNVLCKVTREAFLNLIKITSIF